MAILLTMFQNVLPPDSPQNPTTSLIPLRSATHANAKKASLLARA
jgi:hypothetical protein